jgi:signal transduction histidine kinase
VEDGRVREDVHPTSHPDEQAALHRVAALVARGASEQDVFDAVNEEVAGIVGAETTALMRFESDDTISLLAAWGAAERPFPIGDRRPVDDVLAAIRDGARPYAFGPAEVPDGSPFFEEARERGIRFSVGVPITVGGRVWGASFAASGGSEPFPADTATRIARFTELIGIALANAQARLDLQELADEQAALRRVAELAARGGSQAKVLDAVVAEASRLLRVDLTALWEYGVDGASAVVAIHGAADGLRVGMPGPAHGDGLVRRVLQTGRPTLIEDYAELDGEEPQMARELGFRAAAAAPICCDDRLWGAVAVVARDGPLPPRTEQRLAQFAEIAGNAIAGAQARRESKRLTDEHAALRRVAELVARGVAEEDVFAAVADEARRLAGDAAMTLTRFEDELSLVVVATSGGPAPVGIRIDYAADTMPDRVRRTGRFARVDDYTQELDAELAMQFGLAASVAVPIAADSDVWGMFTATSGDAPLPDGIEDRLQPFAELVAAAIANAESRAKLTASRARVVATADETRRRLQRDLHDGAQQRLVQTLIALNLAKRELAGSDGPALQLLDEALLHAQRATSDLRDLVHGILPAALSQGGLVAGVRSLAHDFPLPVELDVQVSRLPRQVETAAYFVIAETLANIVKHAGAGEAHVRVVVQDGALEIEVRDDGRGGADSDAGSGLLGLRDRVEAGEGTLSISSAPGEGTTVLARLPIGAPAAQPR